MRHLWDAAQNGLGRHADHADIIRESIDGSVGFLRGYDSLRISDAASWKTFHDRIEEAARLANGD